MVGKDAPRGIGTSCLVSRVGPGPSPQEHRQLKIIGIPYIAPFSSDLTDDRICLLDRLEVMLLEALKDIPDGVGKLVVLVKTTTHRAHAYEEFDFACDEAEEARRKPRTRPEVSQAARVPEASIVVVSADRPDDT